MRVAVHHETTYRYESAAQYSVQYLRLSPRTTMRQKVISWKLDTPGTCRPFTDTFGNDSHVVVVDRAHDEIRVRARGEVEVTDDQEICEDIGPQNPEVYRRTTLLTTPTPPLSSMAADFAQFVGKDDHKALEALMLTLRERIEYKAGVTHSATSAAEAFERGAGVCQDHAHVFLTCARALGYPARYVSGYLAAEGAGELASHAWAEIWLPEHGWTGYDVANRARPGGGYVRLAVGLDYLDACPVRGFRRGGFGESLDVEVQVHATNRAPTEMMQQQSQQLQISVQERQHQQRLAQQQQQQQQ
jgi:transglutaminase-like putative cysteine protease